jgi:5-methyltetrahydropteroyltriglutamate--homocysteine methyltransferase
MPGKTPPFRADHVGSLLRPQSLIKARDLVRKGEIDRAALKAVEDEAIRGAVMLQEAVGLKSITDGEFRRASFHMDFLMQLKGLETRPGEGKTHFRSVTTGEITAIAPPKLVVTGKVEHLYSIMGPDFSFLKSVTPRPPATPKITIPSPSMAHFRGGREAIDKAAYATVEAFFADLAGAYRQEVEDLGRRGCRYLQLDDTNLAYLCDEDMREGVRRIGEDPEALPGLYAGLINDSLRTRPKDMVTAIHLCRGNYKSSFVAEGGYDPVAEVLFNEIAVDAFFLEYDTERAGTFSPLRFVPKDRFVVLGIVSSKLPELETKDFVKRRIDDAARHLPLEQLCLSPQCGFSSTEHGNDLTYDDQRRKLELVVEVAREVWGDG